MTALTRLLKTLLGKRIQPHLVNRRTIILIPQEPFIQWVIKINRPSPDKIINNPETNETYDLSMTPEEVRESLGIDTNAYLLPADESGELEEETLRAVYKTLFELELSEWSRDVKTWPKHRDHELFLQWFGISFHGITLDLCQAPLERELWDDSI